MFMMPCYADTIVKVNQIRQTCNEDSKLFAIWAVGVYSIEKIPNSQLIFETNEYYCVGGKIVLGSYNGNLRLKITVASSTHLSIKKDFSSNRCPLKVLLVGVAQDAPKEINHENAILNVLVNDCARQIYSFTIKVVFLHHNSRFKHLMNSTRLHESVLFVVGQIEIIKKDLYVYPSIFLIKKKVNISENTPALYRSVRSRLLNVYQSVNEDSSKAAGMKNSDLDNEK
ncbi:16419_t:CDS:2, partial [Dentiscutata erythropus]